MTGTDSSIFYSIPMGSRPEEGAAQARSVRRVRNAAEQPLKDIFGDKGNAPSGIEEKLLSPIRLGAIAFINTLPVYHCLDLAEIEKTSPVQLVYAPPAGLNAAMGRGELEISPVSSAYYLRNQENLHLLDDLSVSSPGAVESVLFLSKVPLGPDFVTEKRMSGDAVPLIGVPDDSETSIALLAHLLQQKTGHDLRPWFHTYPAANYQQVLEDLGSVLIIGDNALRMASAGIPEGYHCYDMASLWKEETGLPFVFAVWVAPRPWAEKHPERLAQLNQALRQSRERFFSNESRLSEGVRIARSRCTISEEKIHAYFTQCLSYGLDDSHREALRRFDRIITTREPLIVEQHTLCRTRT